MKSGSFYLPHLLSCSFPCVHVIPATQAASLPVHTQFYFKAVEPPDSFAHSAFPANAS